MIERLAVTMILVMGAVIAYQAWKVYHLRRAGKLVSFPDFITGTPGIVLFTADYCQPCKTQQQPAIQRVVQQMQEIQVIEIDVQAQPDLAQQWGVLSLPTTFILDKNGQPREMNFGVTSTDKLRKQIEAIS